MANGTTNFPKPTNPPGDMTYYVTDLPSFDSLAKCAASALSHAVQYVRPLGLGGDIGDRTDENGRIPMTSARRARRRWPRALASRRACPG